MSPHSPSGASKAFAHHFVQVFRERGLTTSNAILDRVTGHRPSPLTALPVSGSQRLDRDRREVLIAGLSAPGVGVWMWSAGAG